MFTHESESAVAHVDGITTVSLFGCQPSTGSAATSADHIRRSGVRCRWPVDVELTAKTFTWRLL